MLPASTPPRLTAAMRATLAELKVRPARRIKSGWRKRDGTRISMKTALALFRAGLVERAIERGREILRPTSSGQRLALPQRSVSPVTQSGAPRWQDRADLA